MGEWVRVSIIGPDKQLIGVREADDPWYAAGGHRHPSRHQQARDEVAIEELREWLEQYRPRPGVYVVWVAELDRKRNEIGQTWANVKLVWNGPADGRRPEQLVAAPAVA